jgi:tetratricopeptide (TPR) repeat protein
MSIPFQHTLEQAMQYHQAGQLAQAEAMYRQVLQQQSTHADALHLLGLLAHQAGHSEAGAALIQQAINYNPKAAGYYSNLALVWLGLKNYQKAAEAARQALELQPDFPEALNNLGLALLSLGEAAPRQPELLAQAEAALRQAVRQQAGYAEAWSNLARCLAARKELSEAEAAARMAARLDPSLSAAHASLGLALQEQNRAAEATEAFRAAAGLSNDADARRNLGWAYLQSGDTRQAIAELQESLKLEPSSAVTENLLGLAYQELEDYPAAIAHHRAAIRLQPEFAEAWSDLGKALKESGDFIQANEAFGKALQYQPDFALARFNRAYTRLLLGDFAGGWPDYEYRFQVREERPYLEDPRHPGHSAPAPSTWLAGGIAGKRLLLKTDQGIGDELFFLRFAPRLKQLGAWLASWPADKLGSILQRQRCLDQIIPPGGALPEVDHLVSVGDLPLLAAMRGAGDIPPPLPLSLLPASVDRMIHRLRAIGPPPYIGVTWWGGIPGTFGQRRQYYKAIPPRQLAEMLRPLPGHILVLQRNPKPHELAEFTEALGRPAHDFSALNDHLEDMLALLALLDDCIGVSNTNMHLRAGTGKPARVLASRNLDWRWQASGKESAWFPGFQVYRQSYDGHWDAALQELAANLKIV